MARIACRICILAAAAAAVLQIISCAVPYFNMIQLMPSNSGLKGGFLGGVRYEYEFYLWVMRLKVSKFSFTESGAKKQQESFYENCYLSDGTRIGCYEELCESERQQGTGCDLTLKDGWFKCDGAKVCRDIPITECFNTMNNEMTNSGLWRMMLPDLPFVGPSGYFIFFGSIFILIISGFSVLSLIAGAIYLYYYSEHKPIKKARTGATVFFSTAPILTFVTVLIGVVVMLMVSTQTSVNPLWRGLAPKSEHVPVWGFWLALCNMILMSVVLCFSKFWKQRKVETARAIRKQRDEDDEVMRAMGIDPDAKMVSSSCSSSMSDSDSGSDSDPLDSDSDLEDPRPVQHPSQTYIYGQPGPRPVYSH